MVLAGLERAAESLMETPTVTGDAAVEQVCCRVDKCFWLPWWMASQGESINYVCCMSMSKSTIFVVKFT